MQCLLSCVKGKCYLYLYKHTNSVHASDLDDKLVVYTEMTRNNDNTDPWTWDGEAEADLKAAP